jgi:hypothetical protein
MEGRNMKLHMTIGLLLAGSLFVGTAIQAQDLTQGYLDAIDQAIATAATAKNERERQEAEENVAEFESALQDLANPQQVAPGFDIPRVIKAVSVECNGNCNDNTLGQICSVAGAGLIPLAVDCTDVDDDGTGVACPGSGNNRCSALTVSSGQPLSSFCRDTSGWDATVYCVAP